jgi:hypothetical protein
LGSYYPQPLNDEKVKQYIYIKSSYEIDLVPQFRDLKLKLISGDFQFSVSQNAVKKYYNELLFIKKNFPDDIITGSIALSLFDLLNREISDVDILIKDESRYSRYNNHNYGDVEKLTLNRLGFIKFDYRKNFFSFKKTYEVDFFKDVGSTFIEFEFEGVKLKVQHPIEIISQKMSMSKHHKHWRDLEGIFYKFGVL